MFNHPLGFGLSGSSVDGIYSRDRLMNTSLFKLGYNYYSLNYGSLDVAFITGSLVESASDNVKKNIDDGKRQPAVGYGGSSLGYELDVSYAYPLAPGVEAKIMTGYVLAGDAWKRSADIDEVNSFAFMTQLSLFL